MTYTVTILRRAQRELASIAAAEIPHIRDAIRALNNDLRPSGCQKSSGREGWRIRVDDYRVIYEIDDSEHSVTVLHIGHRRDVYR